MASNIDYISIDETFPIAGRDNDSQGFRDNFSIIKNNFESAKNEVEDLQLNAARVDQANNFNRQNIVNANFVACSEELFDGGSVSSTTLVSWEDGSYQIFSATGSMQFTLSGFPSAGTVGKMKIQVNGDDVNRQINFAITGGGSFKKSPNVPALPLTINASTEFHIFEFWTYNGGSTVFMDYVGPFE
jgi:hypothetical protein